jgi:long-chain fatty acid transport protein
MTNFNLKLSAVATVGILAFHHSVVQAGGLYIGEFGQPNMGASRAGAQALVEDASTASQNPAGISFLDDKKAMVTGMLIYAKNEFQQDLPSSNFAPAVADAAGNRPAGNGGDAGGLSPGGALFYARPVNDRWGWGVSLGSVSAAILDYEQPDDFAGRYWVQKVELLTINVMPSVSFKVTEDFSLGLSVPVTFGRLDMDISIPGPSAGAAEGLASIKDGEDTVAGVTLSAMWQATDQLRLGVHWISETEMEFEGDLDITLPAGVGPEGVDAGVEFVFPQTLRMSGVYDLSATTSLLFSVAWEEWSAFDEILLTTPAVAGALQRNWDDTWHFALGGRWKPQPRWTHYTGIAYDTDPTDAESRTADMPIDEQWRLSVGTTYQRDNGHKMGVSLTYADYGDGAIDNGGNRPVSGLPWTVQGEYDTNQIVFLGVNYGW